MNTIPSKSLVRRALSSVPGYSVSTRRQRMIRKRMLRGVEYILLHAPSSSWIIEVRQRGVQRLLWRPGTSHGSFLTACVLNLHFNFPEIDGESRAVHFGFELELGRRGRVAEYEFLERLWMAAASLYEAHLTDPVE